MEPNIYVDREHMVNRKSGASEKIVTFSRRSREALVAKFVHVYFENELKNVADAAPRWKNQPPNWGKFLLKAILANGRSCATHLYKDMNMMELLCFW